MEVERPPLRKSFTKKALEQNSGNCSLSSTVGRKKQIFCAFFCKKPALIRLVKGKHFCWSSSCLSGEIKKETIAGRILAANCKSVCFEWGKVLIVADSSNGPLDP